ncbi:MAG: YicC family protein [Bacteroidales bacterium]|nr:YicC family protein [Bacteroidales bacterium]
MKSMTGFAKTQFEIDNRTYSVEIKTLNSKQLDINTKLPTLFRDKDLEIRSLLNVLTRGKVEFLIAEDSDKSKNVSVLNFDVAKTHYAECLKLQQMLDVKANDLLSVVLSQSDVWEVAETKELAEEVWQTIVDNINSAIALVDEFRLHEGKILKKDFIHRINLIEDKLDKVSVYENERISIVKERIRKYFADFDLSVDENRFEQELIYYIEKFDVTEEKVRLRKHIDYFRETLNDKENGKKLGFVVQEIGREINTLGSKANHADIQRIVVEMKDELEKIKEQLGNIL